MGQANTCRVCDEVDHAGKMVQYSIRHYAHHRCFLERFGVDGLRGLNFIQLDSFPAMAADDCGLYRELMAIWKEKKAEAKRRARADSRRMRKAKRERESKLEAVR